MKNKSILLIAVLVFLAVGCNKQATRQGSTLSIDQRPSVSQQPASKPIPGGATVTVTISGHVLNIEIAETQEEQLQGLSGRLSMPQDTGMLFVFKDSHRYTFWMKDMKFPLDFIWIKDNKVFEINPNAPVENVAKDSLLKIYIPSLPVNQVLEVNAGWAEKNGIKVGDEVKFNQ